MKTVYYLTLLLILVGCSQQKSNLLSETDNKTETYSEIEEKNELEIKSSIKLTTYSDLEEKVFDVGNKVHYTDSCAFYFECDCCSEQYLFNTDTTFYLTTHCVGDETLTYGDYSISADTLIFHFSGLYVTQRYNWENEIDSSVVDYYFTDTIIAPFKLKYITALCGKNFQLIQTNCEEIGIETNKKYKKTLSFYRTEELIGRLEKMKTATNTKK